MAALKQAGDASVDATEREARPTPKEPAAAGLHVAQGRALAAAGDLRGATAAYQEALAEDRQCCEAYNGLGNLFATLGDRTTAVTFYQAALALKPQLAELHANLANVRLANGDYEAAEAGYRQAWALKPGQALYPCHLGNTLRLQGRSEEAETTLRQALALRPEYAGAWVNLGFVLAERGATREAEHCYRRAVELEPGLALAHVSLAMMLLKRGAFREGWREQEWRWRWPEFPSLRREFAEPQWRGEPIAEATILLHAEQGFGDAIQFARYVPMVVTLGARVLLEVPRELLRLMASIEGVQVIARGEALPGFAWHCPLMSLPLAFATEMDTIPAQTPYLAARAAGPGWACSSDLRVGLAWSGNAKSSIDRRRSLTLEATRPLRQLPGVAWYSLQLGADEGGFAGRIGHESDFADTAAAIEELDLVISVDTAVAHLAGALGKPVWILLPKVAEWRWLEDRADSPWYPSARLFRQEHAGDWAGVVEQVAAALATLTCGPH